MSNNSLIKIVNWKGYLLLFVICVGASLVGGALTYHFLIVGEDKASLFSSIAAVAVALATFFLVIITNKNIKATKDNVHGQILLQLSGEYASSEMLQAMKHLRKWQQDNENDFVKKFIDELDKKPNWEYDQYRRKVSHHFYQIYLLWYSNVINDKFLRTLVKQGKLDFFFEIIKPLEFAIAQRLTERKFDETKLSFLEETFKFFEETQKRLVSS